MSEDDFDVQRLATYLHLMPDQVSRLADRGKLPGRKVQGQWRFSQADVHHWLERRIGLSDDEELQQMESILRAASGHWEAPHPIADILPLPAIQVPLAAKTRNSVITSMVEVAERTGWLWDPQKMIDAVRAREDLHPTALENGVALMHARRPLSSILGQAFIAFGRTESGVPFGESNGVLTDLFFLICSTDDRGHLQLLARLSRLVADAELLAALRGARCAGGAQGDQICGGEIDAMTAAALPTLFIGDANREEFRASARRMIEQGAIHAADLASARTIIDAGFSPALIVVAQSWPGEFSPRQVEPLCRAAPLARIFRLLGTWMDGSGRTGKPWPATIRANWQRCVARPAADLSSWSMPATATDDDRLLARCSTTYSNPSVRDGAPLIAVSAQMRESADSLLELCRQCGWNAVWVRNLNEAASQDFDCVLFDTRNTSPSEMEALAKLRGALGEVPVIALAGFLRPDDIERFQVAGAAAVVSKPFLADDLRWQIEQLLPQRTTR